MAATHSAEPDGRRVLLSVMAVKHRSYHHLIVLITKVINITYIGFVVGFLRPSAYCMQGTDPLRDPGTRRCRRSDLSKGSSTGGIYRHCGSGLRV